MTTGHRRLPATHASTVDTVATGAESATTVNWFFEALAARGLAGIVLQIYEFKGDWTHECPRCINALATTCRGAHIWFYTTLDPLFSEAMGETDGGGEA